MKIAKFTFIKVLGLVFMLSVMTACGEKLSDDEAFKHAQSLVDSGDYKKAVIELKKQLQENSQFAPSRFLLGKIYIIFGDGASAEKELLRAQSSGMVRTKILPYLGKAYLLQSKLDKLIDEITVDGVAESAIKANILYLRGEAYLNKAEYKQAESLFFEAMKFDDKYLAPVVSLVKLEMRKNNHKKAEAYLSKGFRINQQDAEINIIQGVFDQYRGKFALAEVAYSNALNNLPEGRTDQNFRANTGLITVLILQGKTDKALEKIIMLRKSMPQHPYPKYLMAWLKFQNKEFEKANTLLMELQKVLPGHLPSLLLLGGANYALKNYEQANVYLTRFVNAIPTHIHGRKLLSMTRIMLQQPEKALEILEGSSMQDADLLVLAGHAAAAIGNKDSQLHYLKKAAKAEPTNASIRTELAQAYIAQGFMQEAISELESIKGSDNTVQRDLLLVFTHLRAGSYKKASQLSKTLLAKNPAEPKLHALLGIVKLAEGEKLQARNKFQDAIKQNKKYVPAYIYLARMELEDENFAGAGKLFEQVLLINEKSISAMVGMAQVAGQRSDKEQVLFWLEKSRTTDLNAILPRLILARYYLRTGAGSKALEVAEEIKVLKPNKPDSLWLLGKAQLLSSKLSEASMTFTKLVELTPTSAQAHVELAGVKSDMRKYDEAKVLLRSAITIDPKSLVSKAMLSNLELQTGNRDQALKLAREIQAENQKSAVGYHLEGDIYMATGKFAHAQKAYRKAIEKQPAPVLEIKLGHAYSKEGKVSDALLILTKALGKYKGDIRIRSSLATLYFQQGNTIAARRLYQKIIEAEPANVIALNNLANLLSNEEPEKALTYAQEAYKLAPQSIAITDTFGWLLVTQGKVKEGVEILSSITAKTTVPTIHYHLAVGLSQMGEVEQAREKLHKLLDSKEQFDEIEKARQLLKQLK